MSDAACDASLTVMGVARAAGLARSFLRRHCRHPDRDALDTGELLVSELITNAVLHGSPPVTMNLRCDDLSGISVRVVDGGTQELTPRRAGMIDEGGRGLLLVDALSSSWGVQYTDHGKAVWFHLHAT